jgi:DNA ligase (NAD+)
VIEPPTNCPSCESELVWRNDILYCENSSCEAKTHKRVEHFAKTLKIKGLGPSTIEKLFIQDIDEIYTMNEEEITECLGSEKLAVKLWSEIQRSKEEPLNTVLPAFGIPLIGKSAADKLSKVVDNIFEISVDTCKAAGLGPKATENLLEWLDNEFFDYAGLPFNWEFDHVTTTTETKGIVCISGKLKSFKTKADATKVLEEAGYKVKDSLTKDVTVLLNESGTVSTKTTKAESLGIRIVNNIKDLIGEIND